MWSQLNERHSWRVSNKYNEQIFWNSKYLSHFDRRVSPGRKKVFFFSSLKRPIQGKILTPCIPVEIWKLYIFYTRRDSRREVDLEMELETWNDELISLKIIRGSGFTSDRGYVTSTSLRP